MAGWLLPGPLSSACRCHLFLCPHMVALRVSPDLPAQWIRLILVASFACLQTQQQSAVLGVGRQQTNFRDTVHPVISGGPHVSLKGLSLYPDYTPQGAIAPPGRRPSGLPTGMRVSGSLGGGCTGGVFALPQRSCTQTPVRTSPEGEQKGDSALISANTRADGPKPNQTPGPLQPQRTLHAGSDGPHPVPLGRGCQKDQASLPQNMVS